MTNTHAGPVASTRDLSVTVPDGWDMLTADGADLALAAPERADGSFRPNIVFTSTPSPEPAAAAAADAIAAAFALQPGTQMLSVELYPFLPHDAQTLTYGYETGDTYVLVTQWVVATGTVHVNITASCAIDDMMRIHGNVDALVRGITFTGASA